MCEKDSNKRPDVNSVFNLPVYQEWKEIIEK